MTEKKPQPTMQDIAAQLRDKFIEAAGKTANDVDMSAVTMEVVRDLNASKREVTLKLLGLDNRWGKWEVDHCNGRKSPVGELIDDACTELITQWVNDTIEEVLTTEMRLKTKKHIKDAFLKEIADRNSYKTRELISNYANSFVATIVKEVKDEFEIELGIKE